ncbi:MAG: hypothetical protein ABGW77_03940, partial [Campylobacterales bacterium]
MHRYEELERRYYRRLFLKWGAITGGVVALVGGGYYLYIERETLFKKFSKPESKVGTQPPSPVVEVKRVNVVSAETRREGNRSGTPAVNQSSSQRGGIGGAPTERGGKTSPETNPKTPLSPGKTDTLREGVSSPVLKFQLPELPPTPLEEARKPAYLRTPTQPISTSNRPIVETPKFKEELIKKEPVSPSQESGKGRYAPPIVTTLPPRKTPPPGRIVEKKIDLATLIQSYNNEPTYEKAIKIANIFLKQGNLYLAKIWALKANSIDVKQPESWIIFAKVLLKKGYKEDAIKVLKTYLEDYGYSDQVNTLLLR